MRMLGLLLSCYELSIARIASSIEHVENLVVLQMTSTNSNINSNEIQPLPEYLPYKEDFAFNDDIFDEDSEKIRKIKWVIDHKLSIGEKEIFLLYAHNNSNYHKTAKLLNCSVTTVRNKILIIRAKIKSYL